MTGAETLKAMNGVKVMIQGLTDMVQQLQQGVGIRINDTGDKVVNSAQSVQSPMSMLLLNILLGIKRTGQQTENRIDAVTVEGLEGICGRAVDVDEVRAVKEFVSRAIANDSKSS